MAFAYICGLIAQKPSVNQNADFTSDSPILKVLLEWKSISQSAFSRFFLTSGTGNTKNFGAWVGDYTPTQVRSGNPHL
ncbi:hypothetical protein IT084_08470 [Desulfallas sp. Bu1-1]|uniref:hypothetical protein n=1 Tax=Desulfallas sp. Bu1-1 TaxID=2787620 RepID=UPI00189FF310|nr:hypothetical protein [Desulfallas sp. Bu1-1]MBF7083009.1 hypothetical protein [Desulfallas sp. Bu1-1]